MNEKVQENVNSQETIKNSIADYILENFKTRNSNEKKQEIVQMVDQLSYQERNKILDYISDQARSISEYQNCDDQSQLLYLLKDLKAEEGFLRTIKMDLCELGATVMNQTGPLAKRNREHLGADVYGGLEPQSNFERNEVPQNTFQLDAGYATGHKEYFFNPEKSSITHLGGNTYEITYSFSRERGKYLTSSSNEKVTLQIGESGYHTIKNDFSNRSIQITAPIQNNGQTDIINLNFRDGDKNVTLILSRPNPQQQIFIRH